MHLTNYKRTGPMKCLVLFILCVALFTGINKVSAQTASPFTGEKSSWHGFDRYDFVMDDQTFELTPIVAPKQEGNGVGTPEKGKRRCIVVVPKSVAAGNPWSWQGCYWDHQPQTEVELLKRGFHIAFITPDPGAQWDAWYKFLTEKHGLSKKPAFIGMSRGGFNEYTWATSNPDKVTCIYADNPAISKESLMKLDKLIENDVPLLNICGSIDPLLGNHTLPIESIYQQLGGRISLMIQEGKAHHPHSLRDATPIADFIEKSFQATKVAVPDFVGERATSSYFYGIANSYQYFPSEKNYITCRGAIFGECFKRYDFRIEGVRGATVIVPNNPAPGKPWVFRSDFVERTDVVALALLAKGFYIVTGPVPTNVDGPVVEEWNKVYKYLTDRGFSKKAVMSGSGGAVGEAYAWAIENPDKVSCIYGESPVLVSNLAKVQPIDNLAPLAKAGVPVLHLCGSLDPNLETQTRAAEKKYKALGGQFSVIVREGEGRYLPVVKDMEKVVRFITEKAK